MTEANAEEIEVKLGTEQIATVVVKKSLQENQQRKLENKVNILLLTSGYSWLIN